MILENVIKINLLSEDRNWAAKEFSVEQIITKQPLFEMILGCILENSISISAPSSLFQKVAFNCKMVVIKEIQSPKKM